MPIFRVGKEDAMRLANKPETGMGFQIVDGRITYTEDRNLRGLSHRFVAIGSTLLIPANAVAELNEVLRSIREMDAEGLLRTATEAKLEKFDVVGGRLDARVGEGRESGDLLQRQSLVRFVPGGVAEAFFRFSPFNPDRRVRDDGSFVADTYSSTFNDLRMVPSGFAAVGRYALPSPVSARYVYVIVTNDPYYVGTVVPNYGQAGGGVEVLFPNGATPTSRPHVIPVS